MTIRQLTNDGRLAEKAEDVAEAAGYGSLSEYVMHLLEEDLNSIERNIAVMRAIEENEYSMGDNLNSDIRTICPYCSHEQSPNSPVGDLDVCDDCGKEYRQFVNTVKNNE